MEKIKISELPTFDKVRNEDRLFSHVPSFGELGYIPSSLITSGGVAMRRWNVNNASPIGEAVGDIGFLRELPSLLGLGCYLVDRNHGRRKLDPNNHYKLATGEAAKLDGLDYNKLPSNLLASNPIIQAASWQYLSKAIQRNNATFAIVLTINNTCLCLAFCHHLTTPSDRHNHRKCRPLSTSFYCVAL